MADMIRDKEYMEVGDDMIEHIVGPIPVKTFLRELMTPKGKGKVVRLPRGLPSLKGVRNEQQLVEKLAGSKACPSLELRDTHKVSITTPYTNARRLPDWTVYDGETPEMYGERKPSSSDDPFVDPPKGTPRHKHSFVKNSRAAVMTVGQLTAYGGVMFEVQSRTHAFSFLICGRRCRLLLFDRAGCTVTEAFDFGDGKTRYLWQFFHRYHLMSAEERGHDPSVSFDVTDAEAETVKGLLRAANASDDECDARNFRRIKFTAEKYAEDGQGEGEEGEGEGTQDENNRGASFICEFIVTRPRVFVENVEGACTRGALAVRILPNPEDWHVTYLKDTNRYDDDGDADDRLETEGNIYRKLRKAGVRRIPTLVCSGDADGDWQRTRTDQYLRFACAGVTIFGRRHYYHAVLEVGRPLSSFKSTRELTLAVSGALTAHRDAYEKANILHRDISPGNILITDKGTGLLIDWQFGRKVVIGTHRQPRMEWRVGTWQFYSFALHRHSSKVTHDLRDDLESFLWVLLYMIVHYRPINLDPTTILYYLHGTFDVSLAYEGTEGRTLYYGGDKKLSFLRGETNSFANSAIFEKRIPLPLRTLLHKLSEIFSKLYPVVIPQVRAFAEDFADDEEPVPPIPEEMYEDISDGEEALELQEQWRQKHLAERAHAAAQGAAHILLKEHEEEVAWTEPTIDYSKVNSHKTVMAAFMGALASDITKWPKSDAAEDQIPILQDKFKVIQPNAVNVTPLDASSRRQAAGSSRAKRQREETPGEPNSKRQKLGNGGPSSARSAGGRADADGPDVGRYEWEKEMGARITRARAAEQAAAEAADGADVLASDEEDGSADEEEDGEEEEDEEDDSTYEPSD
ncbi:hypothetical protein PENSPDRAFT_756677 [Peniophora sp. CONT]|nr:hypothetical protein PENSPDRAFT_756677 [Peniophora sp. CONT]